MAEIGDRKDSGKVGAEIYAVPPVERALKLLRHIGDGNTCRNVSTVSKALEINRTTLIRLLHTLSEHRMIEQIADGAGYRLGPGLVSLGAQAMHGRDIVQVCRPVLRELSQVTGLSTHLGVMDGVDIVYLSRETPNSHLVSNVREGSRLPAHASSVGRAILAAMPESEIEQLFAGAVLVQATGKTPKSLEGILKQARADREAGFAWSVGNFEAGIGSCAAVIRDHSGAPVGALNVSGPESVFSPTGADSAETSGAVLRAAGEVSTALGYRAR